MDRETRLRRAAPWIVVLGVAFTSLSAILIRLSSAPPLAVATYRQLFAVLMTAPLWAFSRRARKRPHAAGTTPPADELTRTAAELAPPTAELAPPADELTRTAAELAPPTAELARTAALLVLSGVFLALHFATWFSAVRLTSVVHATVLVTTHPLMVMIASALFLGERPSARAVIGIVAVLVGSLVLAFGGTSGGNVPTLRGNVLAVLGAAAVTGYFVVGRSVRASVEAHSYNLVVYSTAGVVLAVAAALLGQSLGPFAPREYMLFAALAFFCTMLGHSVFNWALRYVRPALVSATIVLEPVFASLIAVPVLQEVPGPRTALGGALAIAGILLVAARSRSTS